MLALLIYCYATGRFGSRTIEAATHSDVAVRDLCANTHPDPDSICSFRATNQSAFHAAFVSVRQLAQQLKLTRVGTGSVDGTKIQANRGAGVWDHQRSAGLSALPAAGPSEGEHGMDTGLREA